MTHPATTPGRALECDAFSLSAQLGQYIYGRLAAKLTSGKRFGTAKFTFVPPTPENFTALGRDPFTEGFGFVIRREDGQYFELDIEVTASPLMDINGEPIR